MLNMGFVIPGGNTGQLVMNRHGAAVVGPIAEKALEHFAVAGRKARAQPREVGAFGQGMKDHAAAVVVTAHFCTGFQQPGGRLVTVDFRVTLIGGDHKIVFVRQLYQCFQLCLAEGRPGWVTRRADKQQLGPGPGVFADGIKVRLQTRAVGARQVHGLAASQQGGTFVNLIERIGHQHQRMPLAVDHCLSEGKQRFPGAVHR